MHAAAGRCSRAGRSPRRSRCSTPEGPKPRVMTAKAPYGGKGGLNKATTDERTIVDWWRKWPKALIGLPMGGATKLFALDFDPREDPVTGEVFTLDALKAALEEQIGCPLPISLASRTQSGGVHVFFRQPDGEPIRNRGNLPRHVDVRGEGGYVIAPPSVMAEECGGGRYRWLEGRQDTVPVEAPSALIEVLRSKGRPRRRRRRRPAADRTSFPSAERWRCRLGRCAQICAGGAGRRMPRAGGDADRRRSAWWAQQRDLSFGDGTGLGSPARAR
jgi:hypothetical protein